MRKLIFITLIGAGLTLATSGANAQVEHHYVRDHPHAGLMATRPTRPSPHHAWVSSEWEWKDGRYVESPGHWEQPPHAHAKWKDGHWAKTKRGSYWVRGRWQE
jgi:hypothetical protein